MSIANEELSADDRTHEVETPSFEVSLARQQAMIAKMRALVAERATQEVALRETATRRLEEAKQAHDADRAQATSEFTSRHAELIATYKQARDQALLEYESEGYALAVEEQSATEEFVSRESDSIDVAKNMLNHRQRSINSAFLEQELLPKTELAKIKEQCDIRTAEIEAVVAEAKTVVSRRCEWPSLVIPPPVAAKGLKANEYFERAATSMHEAREKLALLYRPPAAKFLEDGWPTLIFVFTAVLFAYPAWALLNSFGLPAVIGAGVIVPTIVALGVYLAVRPYARIQTLRIVPDFQQIAAQAQVELATAFQAAKAEADRWHRQLVQKRDAELAAAQAKWEEAHREQVTAHDAHVKKMANAFVSRRQRMEQTHERKLAQIEQDYPPRIKALESEFQFRLVEQSTAYRKNRAEVNVTFEREWKRLAHDWAEGVSEFEQASGEMTAYCNNLFPVWNEVDWKTWRPTINPRHVAALQFGKFEFSFEKLPGGLPKDASLLKPAASIELPAVLSYPHSPSLLIEAEDEGRTQATQLIGDVMLRLMTTFPPGKVRFTIIDPVGLGQNFSAFMHLADYDERLVASRIWTESTHVNQRLADLTEHMENVIQKYLRNEFASIQEYNEHAGEVAEPYQILVIANFPANFSEEAARRLVSITSSGARCGVYTLISTDNKLKLPRNFDLADLEALSVTLAWDAEQERFTWKSKELSDLVLTVERPPDDEQFTEIVRAVGRLAKDFSHVEVPFESVALPPDKWWTYDSRAGIDVPLGRAGAKKLQYMRLGQGTSQHVLMSGKTGSGKSTLLNALITNLAVHYSPNELQFYLIDFKKGVEFKAYAALKLPHARVIAIESEREFGLSALERLDQELKTRGDLFRKAGVQDLKAYRNANPDAVMPRVLLVIDEFQEFFTTDDKISHESSLLLDRLVRQGRAFGIHVLLGSQTLSGAYSLARSTIGQMAVRIALQCSEADAHLILSEDNTAARLLNRPGEAIYNDANGRFEGNHPFQVVWLSDAQRESYLRGVAKRASELPNPLPPPTVFEGNVPADPRDNAKMASVLKNRAASVILSPQAWLGSAVAIKDPTEVVFRRQGGSNLLIVGQQEELATGILANVVASLNAQASTATSSETNFKRFYLLDGTRPESPDVEFWSRLTSRLDLSCESIKPRDVGDRVRMLAAEVDRRIAANELAAEPIYLIVYNLGRFRDLRKSDDFGISSSFDDDTPAAADKEFATILREGPTVGIHVLLWSDSFANLNRSLERSSIRNLELRVLFQMSQNDSSNLMDSPAASRLGTHMALFYSEELGQIEKFRPYGMPSSDWFDWASPKTS